MTYVTKNDRRHFTNGRGYADVNAAAINIQALANKPYRRENPMGELIGEHLYSFHSFYS
jgi:hypothetical protein